MARTALLTLAAGAALLAAACATIDKGPYWPALADCAGAYRANAALADPSRPASMTSMVSDVADDYELAAVLQHRREQHSDYEAATAEVKAREEARFHALAQRPREEGEKFIEACPQLEAP